MTKKAESTFKALKCSEIYATSDGNFFTVENKLFAESHASNGHELFLIEKSENTTEKKPSKSKKK